MSISCYLLLNIRATYISSSNSAVQYIQFLAIGISASLFWMMLFEYLPPQKATNKFILILQEVGTLSLYIYCIHEFFYFEKLYQPIFDKLYVDDPLVQITYSVTVLIMSFMIIKLISSNKYTALFFLGRELN